MRRLRVRSPSAPLPDFDEPEPDLAVVRGEPRDYARSHPGAEDVGLLVEVAETTLDLDTGKKRRSYARGGVPVYGIVNLLAHQIEVYSRLDRGSYRSRVVYAAGRQVPVVLNGSTVARIRADQILPPRVDESR
jgi:Uma2 family endonuclease